MRALHQYTDLILYMDPRLLIEAKCLHDPPELRRESCTDPSAFSLPLLFYPYLKDAQGCYRQQRRFHVLVQGTLEARRLRRVLQPP